MASKKNLAKIHIAKKELGLTDDEYRDALRRITGRDTAAKITDGQARKLLNYFQSQGWRPKYQRQLPGLAVPNDPMSKKIQAIWITLHRAGVVKNGSDRALLAFVRRLTGTDRLEWCDEQRKSAVIEALKAWAAREEVQLD